MRYPGLREVVFGAAFLVAAIGLAAEAVARDRGYYEEVARAQHLDAVRFHFASGDRTVTLATVLAVDATTRAYVLGGGDVSEEMRAFFDADELSHLRDVRAVFTGVRVAAALGAVLAAVTAFGLGRARVRRALVLVVLVVAGLGVAAAVAFEPLFLLFHEAFFPQGNFRFDPARENLTLVYPEAYWLGATLRLGVVAILACVVVAALTALPIRSSADR